MHNLQFDRATEQALTRQADITGKEVDQLIREAVAAFLDDQEDIQEAVEALRRIDSGDDGTLPWEAVKARHGL